MLWLQNKLLDYIQGYHPLTAEEMHALEFIAPLHNDLEPGSSLTNQVSVGRTPFTGGSTNAWVTIVTSSILHNAPAPLFFMLFKRVQELPLIYSTPMLFGIWATAAVIDGWSNKYKFIQRLTEEFALELESNEIKPKKPGTLYFFYTEEAVGTEREFRLHYKILIQSKKNEWVEEIGSLEELNLSRELLNKLGQGRFHELNKADSTALKAAISIRYPHHLPILQPDEDFIPGNRKDYWFLPKCAASEFPTIFSGLLLGYTATTGQTESFRIAAAIILGSMNYIQNILTDMPLIAGAYGTNTELGNIGPISNQPGVWLVLNPLVIGLLKNVAPIVLAVLTAYGIGTAKIIPFPLNGILALVLFPFVASTFLIFTMYALQKLHLPYNNKLLNLNNSLAIEAETWCDMVLAIPGELLGWRAYTISGFLKINCSPYSVATLLAFMNAIGNIALVVEPTADVAQNFLTFFFENSADSARNYLFGALLILECYAAAMSAWSQWPNFHECVKIRAQELGIETNRYSIVDDQHGHAELIVRFAQGTDVDHGGPFVVRSDTNAAETMTAQNFVDSSRCENGRLVISHHTLYGSKAAETQDPVDLLNESSNNDRTYYL